MRRHSLATVGIAVFGLLLTADAGIHAQGSQFQRVSSRLRDVGYSRTADTRNGWLADNESMRFRVWLSAGSEYVITGTCDNDCTDLDLELFTPGGARVDVDLLADDEPIVRAAPHRSGSYEVRVSMARCSIEPCEYTVGVFRR